MENTSCTLTATANTGYEFVNWTKNGVVVSTANPYTFTVTGDGDYVAHFQAMAPNLVTNPTTLDLGGRPIGAWMRPYEFTLSNIGGAAEITSMQLEGTGASAIGLDMGSTAVPFTLNMGDSKTFGLTWGDQAATVNGTLKVGYQGEAQSGNAQIAVTGTVYSPAIGDVWELPKVVSSLPYTETLNATSIPLYNNYVIPDWSVPDGYDVVYQLTFEEDVLLTATIPSGEKGKTALYEEGFMGLGGPDLNNNYTGIQRGTRNTVIFEDDFEDGDLVNWTLVDADNDGDGWRAAKPVDSGIGEPHSGDYCASSWSWSNTAYDPDNWMISPLVEGAQYMVYYAATNPAYPDHYGVYASTTNTDLASFQLIYEENWSELSSKGKGERASMTKPGTRADMTEWKEIVLELPVGTKYVAFRHFNSPDMNYLFIDDVALTEAAESSEIHDLAVTPGTYYLVASSTSTSFSVNIETAPLPCPEVVSNPTPADEAMGVTDVSTQLQWALGENTTEYSLRFGTSPDALDTLVDWTRELQQRYTFTDTLNFHTTYYWQVCERNSGCPAGVEGPVWSFTTALNAPTNLTAIPGTTVVEILDVVSLSWTAPALHRTEPSYKVYSRTGSYPYTYTEVGATTETTMVLPPLECYEPYSSYTYVVTAMYPQGESSYSNAVTINVYPISDVTGHVSEQDGTTAIAGATVNYVTSTRTFSFTTDATGAYSGQVPAMTYAVGKIYASAEGYSDATTADAVEVTAHVVVDLVMDEFFYPAVDVTAYYHPDEDDFESEQARVTWSAPDGQTRTANAPAYGLRALNQPEPAKPEPAEGDRSLQYYRVYRTTWDNNGPYNVENTVVLSENTTNTEFVDADFGTLEDGVYKYGVGVVYGGNRGGNRAIERITLGSLEGATAHDLLPMNSLYEYSYTQQIYTSEEIGTAGTISSITMWMYGNADLYEMPFDIYMKEVDKNSFAGNTDWVTVAESDLVYTGSVTVHNTEAEAYTFVLDTPFAYSGNGNLLIAFNNRTGSWKSGLRGMAFGANGDPVRSISARQDNNAYNPYNPTFLAYNTSYSRNVVSMEIDVVPGVQIERESEIAWSNAMDRGQWLYDQVSLTVTLNSGDSPDSTFVFLGQDLAQYEANAMDSTELRFYLDESGVHNWARFRKGAYTLFIYKEGYEPLMVDLDINGPANLAYELVEILEAPENLYISRTGWAMWDGKGENGLEPGDATRSYLYARVELTDMDDNFIFGGITDKNYMQLPTDELVSGTPYICSVSQEFSSGESAQASKVWVYQPCDLLEGVTNEEGIVDAAGVSFSWTYPEPTGAKTVNTDEDNWYYYDDGDYKISIGLSGGTFYWGIMLPAGSLYDYEFMRGTVTIYNDGTTAPANPVGEAMVTLTGANEFVTVELEEPVVLDPTKNVWVVVYNASGAAYPAACSADMGDANGRWISIDGTTWEDIADYSFDNAWMLRAQILNFEPSPLSDEVIGAMLFRDGEWIAFTTEDHFVDTVGDISSAYELRVVYDGEKKLPVKNSYYAMSCPQSIELAYRQYTISATANPTEGGTVTGAGVYEYGSTITLTAEANEGYTFINWTKRGEEVTGELSFGFTVN